MVRSLVSPDSAHLTLLFCWVNAQSTVSPVTLDSEGSREEIRHEIGEFCANPVRSALTNPIVLVEAHGPASARRFPAALLRQTALARALQIGFALHF